LNGEEQASVSIRVEKSDFNRTIACTAKNSQDMDAKSALYKFNVICKLLSGNGAALAHSQV